MTGIEHEAVTATAPFGGPKRKAPWIEHEGRKIGDSTHIIHYLKDRFGVNPNQGLSDEQQGMALAIQRMIEENLYWVMVNDRWNTAENWPILKSTVLGGLPKIPRELLAPIARRGVMKQLVDHDQGVRVKTQAYNLACRPRSNEECLVPSNTSGSAPLIPP